MVLSGSKIFSEFDQDSIKSYNEKSKEENFLEVGIKYPEELHELHKDLPLLLEIPKIETLEKLAANLHDKNKYVIHMINLIQALNYGLVLKKFQRVIKFNQKAWLKSYIEMSAELKEKAKVFFFVKKNWSVIQFLQKPWKMWEKVDTSNL